MTSELLINTIDELLAQPDTLKNMAKASKSLGRPEAADTIADMIIALTKK